MKKIISFTCALLFASLIFGADIYKVTKVTGKVTYETSAGKFKDVTVGQELSLTSVVNTGVNSTLVLEADGKTFTVKPMSKGTIDSLVSAKVAGGFKKNPGVGTKSIAAAADGTGKGAITASERGSGKGEEDLEIDE